MLPQYPADWPGYAEEREVLHLELLSSLICPPVWLSQCRAREPPCTNINLHQQNYNHRHSHGKSLSLCNFQSRDTCIEHLN
jgi:hypothetical protein